MMMSRSQSVLADERGGVLAIVAVALLALVLVVAFVVDVANWKVHKRHLQLQADAAALAAAHSFSLTNCSNPLIRAEAHKYGGPDASGALALYNAQVGGTPASKMHILINSDKYYGDAGWGDDTDPNGSPCTAKYIDIKATEVNLPWFIGFGGLVRKINAHARVSVLKQGSSNSTLPIAVPNPLPRSAAAIFINEGTGAILAPPEPLTDLGPSGPLQLYGTGTSGLPLVPVAANTGVVIALSGRTSMTLTGTLTEICQQNLTDCYDAGADPPTQGLSFIRGYSTSGSGAQPAEPILRSVELFPTGACVSPYFSDGTCTYELAARIDAGTSLPKANQIYGANGVTLTSSSDPSCALVAGPDQCWHGILTLPSNTGPQDIVITWEETAGCLDFACGDKKARDCKVGGGNKCKGDFGKVQRAFSATDTRSGPIKVVDVCTFDLDPSCTQAHDQSYPNGASHQFAVTIGMAGQLRNATSINEPLVVLRIKSNTGQSLDCDPDYQNLKKELEFGCRPTYVPNTGTPDCSTVNTVTLWGTPQPPAWSCIAVNTGRQPNDISAGLNARLYGGDQKPKTCAPDGAPGHNNWFKFDPTDATGDGTYGFGSDDPRVLNAYLTTYGAFSHVNGTSGSVPVTGFGHFYVTGYTGNGGGFDNPCYPGPPSSYSGSHPDDRVPNDDTGLIVGHFILYLEKVGGDGTEPCDPTSISACVIVMTK
jgi:hypothetical protein